MSEWEEGGRKNEIKLNVKRIREKQVNKKSKIKITEIRIGRLGKERERYIHTCCGDGGGGGNGKKRKMLETTVGGGERN